MQIIPKNTQTQGFSLIQVSVLIAVAGIILASVLPGGELGSDVEKNRITKEKMEKIETAMQSFMAANLRRPCPADGTLAIDNQYFGVEAENNGRCSGGSNVISNFYTQLTVLQKTGATTTNASATVTTISDTTGLSIGMLVTGTNIATDTHIASVDSATQITLDKVATASGSSITLTFTSVAAGVVPTKTLGLPDDYMFDGYGRRIGYLVDIRATEETTCRNLQTTKTSGAIQIMDSATATYTTDNVMWALISYGKNGHGAFPMQGSSIANRINSGASNDDEEINAFINTAGTFATAFTQKLIKHELILTSGATYFDDIIWTQESSKNICAIGKISTLGTRIDGVASEALGSNVATGDINGDGIADMVFSAIGVNIIRVVFGSPIGWSPSSGMAMGTANSSRFITITNDSSYPNFAGSVAAGDIDGNGYDDIVISYGNSLTNKGITVFYGSSTPVNTNTSAMPDIITFPSTGGTVAPTIVLGNFSDPAKKDILALVRASATAGVSIAYVIYGAGSYNPTKIADGTSAWLRAASTGFKLNISSGSMRTILDTGDINNDGYDDMLVSDYGNNILYVLFGKSVSAWGSDVAGTAGLACLNNGSYISCGAAGGASPDTITMDTEYGLGTSAGATPNKAVKFIDSSVSNTIGKYTMTVADMNGDAAGIKDLIFNINSYVHIYYGKTSWTAIDDFFADSGNTDGTKGFNFNRHVNKPTGASVGNSVTERTMIEDINGDGRRDIIFSDKVSDINSLTDSGSIFVALQPSGGWSSIWSPTLGASGAAGTIYLFGDIFTSTGLPVNNDVNKGFRINGLSADKAHLKAIADINNDGKQDLIIGAPDRSSGAGSVYIFFGHTVVPWDSSISLGSLN